MPVASSADAELGRGCVRLNRRGSGVDRTPHRHGTDLSDARTSARQSDASLAGRVLCSVESEDTHVETLFQAAQDAQT